MIPLLNRQWLFAITLCCTSLSAVDLLVFTFDRPMQFYALMESVERYMEGIDTVHVIYRTSNEQYAHAYNECFDRFSGCCLDLHKQGENPHADFKPLVLKCLEGGGSSYILFSVDDSLVTDAVDLSQAAELLDHHGAYAFFLRLGKNISHSFMKSCPMRQPRFEELDDGVLRWRFGRAQGDWAYANTVDMGLYRKSDITPVLKGIHFTTPNTMEGYWAHHVNRRGYGLCFEYSRMLTLPLNLVNPSQNKNLQWYTAHELLRRFDEGLKFDLDPFYQYRNRSTHADDVLPTLVERHV